MPYRNSEERRQYDREYKRGRRAGAACPTAGQTPSIPVSFRLAKAADVLALLEGQVAAVLADPQAGALEKARCVGFLASISLRAIEAGNLAARVEMLERVLKGRNGESAP